ncbi:type II toxin-antitoxin system RelE/ParE family toxin [Dokdonia ponticola]|uniref:Type II toxin-antitoxin system RelE/ParE family toxin n=1 Tax=Dokdonia ponticola TaxID=2041041 RepID=A0ABV9I592_9FLAO
MDYKIKYTKEAIAELNKAFLWYRSKELELGQRFKSAFGTVRLNLKENPEIFKEIEINHRRAVLSSSFPYIVHYLINEKTKTVKIIGVLHQSMYPEVIKERLKMEQVHQIKQKEDQKLQQRVKQLGNIRKRNELEQEIERTRDRGFER